MNFDTLPDELVLAISEEYALEDSPSYRLLPLDSKTDTELIFKSTTSHTYNRAFTFSVLATPSTPPRTLIEYDVIDDLDSGELLRQFITNDIEPFLEDAQLD